MIYLTRRTGRFREVTGPFALRCGVQLVMVTVPKDVHTWSST